MAGSGAPQFNRIVTFCEVHFSPGWYPDEHPDTYTGFVHYKLSEALESGSISITRSDGKVLYFDVLRRDGIPDVLIRENVIKWNSYPQFHSDGPFQ